MLRSNTSFMRVLTLLVFTCALRLSVAAATTPNILFIFADDQRADTIAALGNTHIQTPNLDRLARRGVAFTPSTAPVPFYKRVPGTPLIVDGFRWSPAGATHILTHFHSDHYGGLNGKWPGGPIYCTPVTAASSSFRSPAQGLGKSSLATNEPSSTGTVLTWYCPPSESG